MATDRKARKLSPAQQARQAQDAAKKAQRERLQKVLAATPDRMIEKGEKDGVRMEIWKNPATGKFRVLAYAEVGTATLVEGVTLTEARREAGIVYNPPEKLTRSSADCWAEVQKNRK